MIPLTKNSGIDNRLAPYYHQIKRDNVSSGFHATNFLWIVNSVKTLMGRSS